ncbi:MAG: DUF5009 domain-containing protein [Sphingobacteriaceae bacterium]
MINQLPKRLLSIDVFRAVTMLLMIFVNDVSGMRNLPAWIEHAPANEDSMGFADTIFPAFLFIVGLSMPFALQKRMSNGNSFFSVAGYIIIRSAALIIMGFFHVNMEDYSGSAFLPKAVWGILVTVAFFLIWLDYPKTMGIVRKYSLTGLGILLLLLMAILFKGGTLEDPHGLRPSWWGILGIIGWAYLVCAMVFLIARGNLNMLLAVFLIFIAINIGKHMGLIHFNVWVLGDAASECLTMAGVLVSLGYAKLVAKGKSAYLWLLLSLSAIVFIIAGLVIRPYAGGISKIYSTPSWVFLCTGISMVVFELFIFLVDIKHKFNWFNWIKPAGTSTLTCYLMPYLFLFVFEMIHFYYPYPLNEGLGGIFRSFAFAFVIIALVGVMEKKNLRLKI